MHLIKNTHDQQLLALFRRFCEFNVAVNIDKCNFGVKKFLCICFEIDENGFRPQEQRLSPFVNALSPMTL